MAGIQNCEQVSELIHNLEDLQSNSQRNVDETRRERIMDPPVINPKGRPRTTRLTNAREGRQRGGGATNKTRTQPQAESEDSESQAAFGPPPKKSRVERVLDPQIEHWSSLGIQ
ncbi:hypothetical protein B0H13DRAFT_1880177 [Mycena leptocephala]|nr:hypothetical protein B0H13DRAFT_1880177 [Mycena leptocephala]